MELKDLAKIKNAKTGRFSSWDVSGRNNDAWTIEPGQSRVLADIKGPGCITHIWMTQEGGYRDCLLKITWDGTKNPSVLVPLGDFFGLGHTIVNSYQSLLFSASAKTNYTIQGKCALNSYAPMPFAERALVELVNQGKQAHRQFFYIDYEAYNSHTEDLGYFHAEWRRENPFGGWGPEILVNKPQADIANKEKIAWENNYVILKTKGRGHYIGCNLSVTNFQGTWWGEGDDMIWVDGYKWPPDIHGTGSEDYFNQAFGMQENAFQRCGSSIWEGKTIQNKSVPLWGGKGGYQTSYVFHVENPVRFQKEIKVTIEHGHGNHLGNEVSSTAYWYAEKPTGVKNVPPAKKRAIVLRDNKDRWLFDKKSQVTSKKIKPNKEMIQMKNKWAKKQGRSKTE